MKTNARLCQKLLGVLLTISLLGSVASAHSWFICIGNDGHVTVEELRHSDCGVETGHSSEADFAGASHDPDSCVDLRIEPRSVVASTGSLLAVPSCQVGDEPPVTAPDVRHPAAPVATLLKLLLAQRSVVQLI
jgi:hypothetical protein